MRGQLRLNALAVCLLYTLTAVCQTESQVPPPAKPASGDSGYAGVGVKVSSLGVGVEAAARVAHKVNVRAGVNVLGYTRNFSKDGITYDGHLDFRTFEGHVDFFPWARGFHVSPGVLVYSGDPIKASASVPGGKSFTLGGVTYYSDTAVPTTGTGKIDFNQAAPMITVGWGNLAPRTHKHFSFHTELGVAFQGSPQATLNLTGNVCSTPGVDCRPATTDSGVQANVASEQHKINNSMSFFQAYPILSFGFGYKF